MGRLLDIARQSAGERATAPGANAQAISGSALPDHAAEVFTFAPPGDPASDAEAMAERAAILAVENGWDEVTALQEARWQADRERCWRAFLRNAERILKASAHQIDNLLARYGAEATHRYGERTGMDMAQSLRGWIVARRVH